MTAASTQTVSLDEIERVTHAALVKHGARDDVAAQVAGAVRIAEQNGNRICGLYYLDSYCKQLTTGRVSGTVEPVVHHEKAGAVRVDAKFGFAQTAFAAGFTTAVDAARANGVCALSIEHSHTCTSLGYFTEQFARAGMIALGSTNSTARVAPPGGKTPVLGTNPVALAVPDGDGGIAFQWDFSTSAVALGKITMAAAAGESIPLGWAVDADGNGTTDPDAALGGALLSAGGYKGYGLSLMVELFASALTGSLPSADLAPLKAPEGKPHDIGQFYLVIDPQAFSGQQFFDTVTQLAERIGAQEGARLPGSERDTPSEVELDPDLWSACLALAAG